MSNQEISPDQVDMPCPRCGESRVDFLVWLDDEIVQCTSCGETYEPGQNTGEPDGKERRN